MNENLRVLVDLRTVMQKNRIAFGLRVDAINRDADNADDEITNNFEHWQTRFLDLEKEADDQIRDMAKGYPIINQMVEVKGISFILASKVISFIDISRAPTVSALWKYAGYGLGEYWTKDDKIVAPKQGYQYNKDKERVLVAPTPKDDWTLIWSRDRLIAKYLSPYNTRLKTTIYTLSSSFLKSNSPYREIYDTAKENYETSRDWTKNHRHLAAMRKMSKMFLSHLHLRWREIEGYPATDPYIMEDPKHNHMRTPEEFGWPSQ